MSRLLDLRAKEPYTRLSRVSPTLHTLRQGKGFPPLFHVISGTYMVRAVQVQTACSASGALSLRCSGCIPPQPRVPLYKSTRLSDPLILGGILRADSSNQSFISRCWHAALLVNLRLPVSSGPQTLSLRRFGTGPRPAWAMIVRLSALPVHRALRCPAFCPAALMQA